MCTEYHVATVAFAMLGKGLISIAFCCIYVFANEIFPTEVRNVGVGAAVMFGGVSNMAAAYFGGPLVRRRRYAVAADGPALLAHRETVFTARCYASAVL